MNDIHIDFDRTARQGFPEIIYGEYKTIDQLVNIVGQYNEKRCACLITRLQKDKGEELCKNFSEGKYNSNARSFVMQFTIPKTISGLVGILSAGTSDTMIACEVQETLGFLGLDYITFLDKGVAGIHRLQEAWPELSTADVIICIAGFEGALASVVGGIAPQPVIAVPTSIGYGVAKNGRAALDAMLASCALGITVVNIDNGCGAALAAYRILGRNRKYDGFT